MRGSRGQLVRFNRILVHRLSYRRPNPFCPFNRVLLPITDAQNVDVRWFSSDQAARVSEEHRNSSMWRRRTRVRRRNVRDRIKKARDVPLVAEKIVAHSEEDFLDLFDRLTRDYPIHKVKLTVQKAKELIKDSQSDEDIPLSAAFVTLLRATPSLHKVQVEFLEYLLSISRDALISRKENAADETESPEMSTSDDTVVVFKKARVRAIEQPLLWRTQAGADKDAIRKERLNIHGTKSEQELEVEAQTLHDALQGQLPRVVFNAVISLVTKYAHIPEGATEKRPTLRNLAAKLERESSNYFHIVAPLLADFFYMEPLSTDNKLQKCNDDWGGSRNYFGKDCLEIQNAIIQSINQDRESGESLENTGRVATSASQKRQRLSHVAFDAMILHEPTTAQESGLQQDDLEGFASATVHSSTLKDAPKESDHIMFVDNLPVDITREEVFQLYSRCGDVLDVTIFNQRPDLDPGPLTAAKIQERRKRQARSVSLPQLNRRWTLPRTPVYASLKFASKEGICVATEDAMRIFGVVFRKHPIKSIRSSDLTTLYIEGIGGQPCTELEYAISKALNPEVFVSLDVGQNKTAMAGSCEVRFPDFELAQLAFPKLVEVVESREATLSSDTDRLDQRRPCSVNWMRTPKDAEKWWNRYMGFD